jgi:hypothetical protein
MGRTGQKRGPLREPILKTDGRAIRDDSKPAQIICVATNTEGCPLASSPCPPLARLSASQNTHTPLDSQNLEIADEAPAAATTTIRDEAQLAAIVATAVEEGSCPGRSGVPAAGAGDEEGEV